MTKNTHIETIDIISNTSVFDQHSFEGFTIFQLCYGLKGPDYKTLKEAHHENLVTITEIPGGASVPELKLTNNSKYKILLLDGEELAGAKQNRILNTSILIDKNCEIIIPVTCTEEGRWNHETSSFYDSDEIVSAQIRAKKMKDVSFNLNYSNKYDSDQGAVWDEIKLMAEREDVYSNTKAMKDIYDRKKPDLDRFSSQFPLHNKQNGLLVYFKDKPIGLDLFSSSNSCSQYHEKLLRSYRLFASVHQPRDFNSLYKITPNDFFEKITKCEYRLFESIGLGNNYRYSGSNIVGSLLEHNDELIHLTFLNLNNSNEEFNPGGPIHRGRRFYD